MNPNRILLVTFLLATLSIGLGYRNYTQTKQAIVSDLNQALHQSVLQHKEQWLNQDSIRAYAQLQEVMGTPIILNSAHQSFTDALRNRSLTSVSGLSLQILKDGDPQAALPQFPQGTLLSDTLIWVSPTEESNSELTFSFRAYSHCSTAMIFSLSNQQFPAFMLLAALLCGMSAYLLSRKARAKKSRIPSAPNQRIVYGNLSLCIAEACFYNEQNEHIKLTPLQYALMEMFYLSSSHSLLKTDICQSLWPGKENADETLYTLVRRLKLIIEKHSNLKITTDRGRAYGLEVTE